MTTAQVVKGSTLKARMAKTKVAKEGNEVEERRRFSGGDYSCNLEVVS